MKIKINRKMIAVSIVLTAAVLWIIYYAVRSPDINLLGVATPRKITQFEGARVAGWESGKKLWQFYAEEAWGTKFGRETYLTDVRDGIVYKDGEAVVKDLKAKTVKIFKYSNNLEAYKYMRIGTEEVKGYLQAYLDLSKVGTKEGKKEEPRMVFMTADSLKYDSRANKTHLSDNIMIKEKGLRLLGNKIEADHNKKLIEISGNSRLEINNSIVTGGKIIADFEGGKFDVLEHAEIVQENKAAVGDRAEYIRDDDTITLSGKVELVIEKGTAILSEEVTETMRNPEAKESLADKTLLKCDVLTIKSSARDAFAKGNVVVDQKEKSAKSDRAEYISKEDKIILTGNVTLKKGAEWIKTNKVIVSVKDETFEAVGGVETKFKLKR